MSRFENVKNLIVQIRDFPVDGIARTAELGAALNFSDAVGHATKLVDLFKKLPFDLLQDYPDNSLLSIGKLADRSQRALEQIRTFHTAVENPTQVRDSYINNLKQVYSDALSHLLPIVSYSLVSNIDIKKIEAEAQEEASAIKEQLKTSLQNLEAITIQATSALEEIRKTAAEQGVSQEAHHFDTEAEEHDKSAKKWRNALFIFSAILITCGIFSIFIYKWLPGLTPYNWYEGVQLVTSKIIIFSVLAYIVVLCGKSLQAHRHNETLNKQRRNALKTYRTLVEGGLKPETQDIILQQAARCIFEHQDTGFAKNQNTTAEIPSPVITLKTNE